MSKALSMDLRDRVLDAIEQGATRREAARRFGVSAASAIRWHQRQKAQGSARPGPLGKDRQSQHMEGHAATILNLLEAQPDATLAELQAALAERDVAASSSGLWRFFQRLCGTGAGSDALARRHRRHGQPARPQGRTRPRRYRGRGGQAVVPSALQSRLQSHRKRLRQAQGRAQEDRRPHHPKLRS